MKTFLSLQECLGQQQIDRYYHANPPPYSPNVVNQTVDYGGVRWKGNPGSGWNAVGMTGQQGLDNAPPAPPPIPTFQDVLNNANQLNTAYQQGVAPSISTLQSTGSSLQDRYQNLLNTITQQGSVAVNAQTLATNSVLGARGIDSSQGYGAQQMAQSLLPVTTANQGAVANLGVQESSALTPIAAEIASLQNTMPQALTTASGLYGAQLGLAGQQAQAAAQIQASINQANAIIAEANRPFAVPQGQSIFNPSTGGMSFTAPSASLPSVGGNNPNNTLTNPGNNTSQPASNLPKLGQTTPLLSIPAPTIPQSTNTGENLFGDIGNWWNNLFKTNNNKTLANPYAPTGNSSGLNLGF